jgi:uncharacterized protein with FMN-binding domain
MKKFVVAVFIVGAFILYSFWYHSNAVALVPTSSTASSSSTDGSSTNTASSAPTTSPTASTAGTSGSGTYKDGTYIGSVADAIWGNVQVQAVIQNGKITSVKFLQYPNDRNRSIMINSYADPQLSSEAIQAQSANVDIVTGATDSSQAFIQSLSDALSQAKA